MADMSLSSEPIPAGGRRILIVSAATLGFQCLIALGICLFGAAIAAVEASGDMSAERAIDILVVFTQGYAEVVGVFSAFSLLFLLVSVIALVASLWAGACAKRALANVH